MHYHQLRTRVRLRRLPWLCLTWVCVGLGSAGTLLPLVPTTPFLLVAVWAAPKGSPRIGRWLRDHPRFGPSLRAWREERAIPVNAKRLALVLLASSWLTLWLLQAAQPVLLLTALMFIAVATFIFSRPNPQGANG